MFPHADDDRVPSPAEGLLDSRAIGDLQPGAAPIAPGATLAAGAAYLTYGVIPTAKASESGWFVLFVIGAYLFGVLMAVLGITTINAWLAGIPEKTYKNRKGHALWNFMMQ